MSCMSITDLPIDCAAHILSLTSPIDAIRSSAVSKRFLLFSESDDLWEKFLPSDLIEIVSQSSTPHLLQQLPSKKTLFLHLCRNPLLLNAETRSFALDKWSGKICYMLGARALSIKWGDTPRYWDWRHAPHLRSLNLSMESSPLQRFPESAKLLQVCWLLIEGSINPMILSPNTTYGAYFVYEIGSHNPGFKHTPVKVYVVEVLEVDMFGNHLDVLPFKSFYLTGPLGRRRCSLRPYARDDGRTEIEMGRYYVHDWVNERVMLKMILKGDVNDCVNDWVHWGRGLIVHGIELRPLN